MSRSAAKPHSARRLHRYRVGDALRITNGDYRITALAHCDAAARDQLPPALLRTWLSTHSVIQITG